MCCCKCTRCGILVPSSSSTTRPIDTPHGIGLGRKAFPPLPCVYYPSESSLVCAVDEARRQVFFFATRVPLTSCFLCLSFIIASVSIAPARARTDTALSEGRAAGQEKAPHFARPLFLTKHSVVSSAWGGGIGSLRGALPTWRRLCPFNSPWAGHVGPSPKPMPLAWACCMWCMALCIQGTLHFVVLCSSWYFAVHGTLVGSPQLVCRKRWRKQSHRPLQEERTWRRRHCANICIRKGTAQLVMPTD